MLATSGLNGKRHERLKMSIPNELVTKKIDILPKNLVESDDDLILSKLEGSDLVSPAAGIVCDWTRTSCT